MMIKRNASYKEEKHILFVYVNIKKKQFFFFFDMKLYKKSLLYVTLDVGLDQQSKFSLITYSIISYEKSNRLTSCAP